MTSSLTNRSRRRLPAFAAALGLLIGATAGLPAASANIYDPAGPSLGALKQTVRDTLQKNQIPLSDVGLIELKPEYDFFDDGEEVVGYNAWVRLKSCERGYVVVDLSRHGFVRQIYGYDGCMPAGLAD